MYNKGDKVKVIFLEHGDEQFHLGEVLRVLSCKKSQFTNNEHILSFLGKTHCLYGTQVELVEDDKEQVNHPVHYNTGSIEVIDFINDKELNYNRGNVIKYTVRAGLKDKSKEVEDLEKAIFYLQDEIKRISKNNM